MYTLMAPKEIQELRMRACKRCPHLHETTGVCKVCKCVVALKTRLADASCPTGRWAKHKG